MNLWKYVTMNILQRAKMRIKKNQPNCQFKGSGVGKLVVIILKLNDYLILIIANDFAPV